jgi:hypothetical protein
MANEMNGYPSLDNLEGKTVEELLALRQQLRETRDRRRVAINDEITAAQAELRRESVNQRRIFDIELNELKRQLDEIGTSMGSPAARVKAADIREKMSDLKYRYNMAVVERDTKDARLANDRVRRNAQNQLEYENAEIAVCKVIRDMNGFNEFGMPKKKGDGEAAAE